MIEAALTVMQGFGEGGAAAPPPPALLDQREHLEKPS
jgi:hypothetical protein